MKNFVNTLSVLAFAVLPFPAAGAAPLRTPTNKWVVDYAETHCTASRTYGSEESPTTLAFRPSPNGNVVRLVVARPGSVRTPKHFPVKTSITEKTTGLRFQSSNKASEIIWITFDRAALEDLKAAGEIAINGGDVIDERFALPGIASVLKALDECNEDLRTHWNVGEAGVARLTRKAVSEKPLHTYVSADDYPAQAARESARGPVRMMLMVDEAGTLKDCIVEETSGIATLDAMACSVYLQRAKFSPALDAAGKPTKSVITTRIHWKIYDS